MAHQPRRNSREEQQHHHLLFPSVRDSEEAAAPRRPNVAHAAVVVNSPYGGHSSSRQHQQHHGSANARDVRPTSSLSQSSLSPHLPVSSEPSFGTASGFRSSGDAIASPEATPSSVSRPTLASTPSALPRMTQNMGGSSHLRTLAPLSSLTASLDQGSDRFSVPSPSRHRAVGPHPQHPHRPPSTSVSYPSSSAEWEQNRPRAATTSVASHAYPQAGDDHRPAHEPFVARRHPAAASPVSGSSNHATLLPHSYHHRPEDYPGTSSTPSQGPVSRGRSGEGGLPEYDDRTQGPSHRRYAPSGVAAAVRPGASRPMQANAADSSTVEPYREGAVATSTSRVRGNSGSGAVSGSSFGRTPLRRPSLSGVSREQDGKLYRLVVVQSPSRARMCGFGDKDRRPLSPTLIVKLIIVDVSNGRELAAADVDTSAFFLAADLVHPEELDASPRNLLVHHHHATVSTSALQQQQQQQTALDAPRMLSSSNASWSSQDAAAANETARERSYSDPWTSGISTAQSAAAHDQPPPPPAASGIPGPLTTIMTETYTRNFVGASVASANILKDEKDRLGIFFVLQDLSVRTEGVYRIKLLLANLSGDDGQIKPGVSEALAETYTEPFTVYTPRRFPGVIEPTALSKKFAAQGVKIPVRVDRKKRRRDSNGLEGDEEGGHATAMAGGEGRGDAGGTDPDDVEADDYD